MVPVAVDGLAHERLLDMITCMIVSLVVRPDVIYIGELVPPAIPL